MPRDIQKMKRERKAVIDQMRSIIDAAEQRPEKSLTSEEQTKYNDLKAEVDRRDADIQREEQLQALENGSAGDGYKEPTGDEIRSFGEFLQEARFNPNSQYLEYRDLGQNDGKSSKRALTFDNGPSAGILVPEQYDKTIRMWDAAEAIFRPRAMVIPAGDPPDAAFNLMALDQDGAKGVYSGVSVRWVGEKDTRQDAGDPSIRGIKIEPKEVSGYIDISDKLFRNAAAVGSMCERLLRGAILGAEEDAFYTGDGVGKPLGIIGHSATIPITRASAGAISYADVIGMYARAKFGGSLIWVASQTILPQLMGMVDAGNNHIWQPNAREGAPGTLLGIPLIYNDQSPVLGSEGDLALVDLNYYAIKDGAPLAIFIDPYTQKINGVTRIYAFWNVDGQPMLTTPMLQRDGQSTVSPFVVLK
jgi:HK97 family phage major capsid protein